MTVSILPASLAIIIILIPEQQTVYITLLHTMDQCLVTLYYANIIGSALFKDIWHLQEPMHGKVRGYSLHVLLHEF